MSTAFWGALALLSVKKPAEAARQLLALQIPRKVLWMVLFLITICNTILFSFSDFLTPGPTPLSTLIDGPFMMLILVAGGLILTVYSVFWCGRLMGGKGTLDGVMVLIVWLQGLRLVVQTAALILVLTFPLLSALLVLVAVFVWMYLLVHFVNQAHQLNSLGRAAGVLIASMIIPALGLAFLIAFIGVPLSGAV